MKLFFDIIINQNVAALTIDVKKIEYNLSLQGINLGEFLESAPKGDAGASCTLSFGEYVLMFSIDRQLKEVSMVAFNYTFDLDGNFDLFADRMSPSSIVEFFEETEKIRKSDKSKLNKIELSDNQSVFKKAYSDYQIASQL